MNTSTQDDATVSTDVPPQNNTTTTTSKLDELSDPVFQQPRSLLPKSQPAKINTNATDLTQDDVFFLTAPKITDRKSSTTTGGRRKNSARKESTASQFLDSGILLRNNNLISPAALLAQRLGEMREVQTRLDDLREFMQDKEKTWKDREVALKKKKIDFLKRINDMQRFTRNVNHNIEKCKQKATEERTQNDLKTREMDTLNQKMKELDNQKASLEAELERLRVYQQYLESVCKTESTFDDLEKVIKRHETLHSANMEMKESIAETKEQIHYYQELSKKETKDVQNKIFELNSFVAKKKNELETKRGNRKTAETELASKENSSTKVNQQLSQIIMSINNLYIRCQNSRQIQSNPTPEESASTLYQLDMIHMRLTDLKEFMKIIAEDRLEQVLESS